MSKAPLPSVAIGPAGRGDALTPSATRWAITLLTGMNLLNYVDRYALPAVIDSVQRDIPMSYTSRGFVLSAFIWVYMLTAPVFGRLGDRVVRKYLIALGVALWSFATAAAAFAWSYPTLLLARGAVGVGEAAYATLAPALIGDYYPPARRGRIMTVFYVAIPVGSALGYVLAGSIAAASSWRTAFLAVGAPGLVFAALALAMREPPRGQFDEVDEGVSEVVPFGSTLRSLGKNRVYVTTVAGYTAYTFAIGGLAQWMPSYLIGIRRMSEGTANQVFGLITVATGLAGTAVGGALAEALRGRVRRPELFISWVSALLAVPPSIIAFRATSHTVLWTAIAAAEFLAFMSTGPVNTVLVNCVPATMRATAFAVSIFVTHLLGDAISPPLIGVVGDWWSLQMAVMLVPLALVLGSALWFKAQKTESSEVS